MSQARLAAEAFFERPTTSSAPEVDEPTVVHGDVGGIASQSRVSPAPAAPADAQPRKPKVFRLPGSSGSNVDGLTPPKLAGAQATDEGGATSAASRRHRDPMHGVVRPASGVGGQAQELPSSAPRLAQLRAQLQAVELEIEREKARGSQAAIQWIRQAMLDYDLSPADLGLR